MAGHRQKVCLALRQPSMGPVFGARRSYRGGKAP
ncbi:MAG: hypothetical protein ACLSUW_01060 [Akkermansia sp.]